MSTMRVMLDDGAKAPERVYDLDAGYDLFTPIEVYVGPHSHAFVNTGVHVQLPPGTAGHVRTKSGLDRDFGIMSDGTVDEGYDGPIGVTIHNHGDIGHYFRPGDKIAQLVIEKIERPQIEVVESIEGGSRGSNGFGSTGR